MCFSAEVSFTASAVLTLSGAIAVKQTTSKSQVAFACIPFIFAAQQLAEGLLWLSYRQEGLENYRTLFAGAFLFFAQAVWPFWVPFAILKLEDKPVRRTILKSFLAIGSAFALYVVYCLFNYPFSGYPESHHIKYEVDFPMAGSILAVIFYFIPTIASCIVSGIKHMTVLGTIIFSSYILAKVFYSEYSISVWCFFSAIISALVIYIVHIMPPVSTGHTNRSTHAMEG
jgi:hypothetical protein